MNKRLRYLDVAFNVIDINALRPLRAMIEKSNTLHFLSISGLYKFNPHAIQALQDSLIQAQSLKVLDLKKTTREFYFAME